MRGEQPKGTEYDRGVNTFSPEGRLFQVEYAIEAIKLGSTAIGLKTKEGVVLAVEKRITSPLLEPSSVEKVMEIDEHIGCAMSGLIADARTLVEHARVETQNHRFSYGEPMTVESTTQALCDLALRFGEGDEESMSRPFGVSLLIAGHDENGPSLVDQNRRLSCSVWSRPGLWPQGMRSYYTDPSGTFWQCNAKAIGSGSEGADSSLQEQYNKCELYKSEIGKNKNKEGSQAFDAPVTLLLAWNGWVSICWVLVEWKQDVSPGEALVLMQAISVVRSSAGSFLMEPQRLELISQMGWPNGHSLISLASMGLGMLAFTPFDLTLKEAEAIALSILKQVMEEKVTPNNVDIAKVAPTYHLYTPAEVEAVISRL
ncbi:hypothetical protein TIFTF001_028534 [Ficus carica]|uniref:Proteasome alpha-type subunits domain-containing protein n=1 Tax=Ficus carica TaxID=3494 RepID=A0AA88DQ35_FICCA|nr:hypothetical protein TIFTF001_028534 [Ficus carica]